VQIARSGLLVPFRREGFGRCVIRRESLGVHSCPTLSFAPPLMLAAAPDASRNRS
jgi:hypothetical protein